MSDSFSIFIILSAGGIDFVDFLFLFLRLTTRWLFADEIKNDEMTLEGGRVESRCADLPFTNSFF
jgi:hypothetical protein